MKFSKIIRDIDDGACLDAIVSKAMQNWDKAEVVPSVIKLICPMCGAVVTTIEPLFHHPNKQEKYVVIMQHVFADLQMILHKSQCHCEPFPENPHKLLLARYKIEITADESEALFHKSETEAGAFLYDRYKKALAAKLNSGV